MKGDRKHAQSFSYASPTRSIVLPEDERTRIELKRLMRSNSIRVWLVSCSLCTFIGYASRPAALAAPIEAKPTPVTVALVEQSQDKGAKVELLAQQDDNPEVAQQDDSDEVSRQDENDEMSLHGRRHQHWHRHHRRHHAGHVSADASHRRAVP